MAAKTPVSSGTGWLHPSEATVQQTTNGTLKVVPNDKPGRTTHYFDTTNNIDDGDVWTSNANWNHALPAVSFITTTSGAVAPSVAKLAGALVVTFQTDAANQEGYLIMEPRASTLPQP